MSLRQFFINLFKRDKTKRIQQENERLKANLHALDKLRKELEENHYKN